MNTSEELIQESITEYKSGNKNTAKRLLASVVKKEPDNARAWYLLSQAVDKKEQAIYCLSRVLKINPDNSQAKNRLRKLEGTSKPGVCQKHCVNGMDRDVKAANDLQNGWLTD